MLYRVTLHLVSPIRYPFLLPIMFALQRFGYEGCSWDYRHMFELYLRLTGAVAVPQIVAIYGSEWHKAPGA